MGQGVRLRTVFSRILAGFVAALVIVNTSIFSSLSVSQNLLESSIAGYVENGRFTDFTKKFKPAVGGIVLFIHVPKCGGTTIRDNFSNKTKFPRVSYQPVYSLKQFRNTEDTIERYLSNQPSRGIRDTLFVEIHGHNTPTLPDLEPTIRAWKQTAQIQQLPFFAFTLLRDPVELSVSFFNFFHVFGDARFGPQMKATLDNFRNTLQWNPQCLYLYQGERPYFRPDKFYNVTPDDCEWVATTLTQSMDWVGDTRRMSKETLPLLTYLVTGDTTHSSLKSSNIAETRRQKNRPLRKEDLDLSTVELVRSMTKLDQQLHQRTASQHFSLRLTGRELQLASE